MQQKLPAPGAASRGKISPTRLYAAARGRRHLEPHPVQTDRKAVDEDKKRYHYDKF